MRIFHVANYAYNNHGNAFANPDQKIQHGFTENGHYSYLFPVNDIARQLSWRNSKKGGKAKMNQSFIDTCLKVQPELLVLGHGQLLDLESIQRVKDALPHLKIIQWFVDPLEYPHVYQFILDRLPLLDAVYLTTGGKYLDLFRTSTCRAHFFPNPVHRNLEPFQSFREQSHTYDLIFVGNDSKDPARRALLTELDGALSGQFKLGIFGSLGRPGIHGQARDQLFRSAKASLNLTRHEPMTWYSSDRISQLMGNGLLTCTRAEADLDQVYGADALLTYRTTEELVSKLAEAFSSGAWRNIAQRGWEKVHSDHSCAKVTEHMLTTLYS